MHQSKLLCVHVHVYICICKPHPAAFHGTLKRNPGKSFARKDRVLHIALLAVDLLAGWTGLGHGD